MSSATSFFETAVDPIEIAQLLAVAREWEFDLIDDDQIALNISSVWGDASVTLAWSAQDESLRLVCGMSLTVPKRRLNECNNLLGMIHAKTWLGTFALWPEQKLVTIKYQLLIDEETMVSEKLIERIIDEVTDMMECFYPAIKSVAQTGDPAEKAINMAINKAYGRA